MIMISSMMIGECKLIVSADDESNIIDEEHENLIQDNEQKEVGEDEINKEETTLDNAEKSVRETEIQGRSVVNFNKGWQFNKNDTSSEGWDFPVGGESGMINLPHCWEYTHPEKSYIPAMNIKTVTYTKELNVVDYQGINLFIRFNGSSKNTDLYIDDQFVATHVGGYSAFVFDITDYVQNKEKVTIRVDVTNIDTDSIPINVDYTQWAGIYRDVELISTEEQYIAVEDYASSGLYIDSTINGEKADVYLRAKISNKSDQEKNITIKAEIKNIARNIEVMAEQEIAVPAITTAKEYTIFTEIPNVHLWQ